MPSHCFFSFSFFSFSFPIQATIQTLAYQHLSKLPALPFHPWFIYAAKVVWASRCPLLLFLLPCFFFFFFFFFALAALFGTCTGHWGYYGVLFFSFLFFSLYILLLLCLSKCFLTRAYHILLRIGGSGICTCTDAHISYVDLS